MAQENAAGVLDPCWKPPENPPAGRWRWLSTPYPCRRGSTRVSQPPETPADTSPLLFGAALTLPSPRSNVLTRRASLLAELAELQQQNVELCLMLERYSTAGVSTGSLQTGDTRCDPTHERGFPARGRAPKLLLAVPKRRTWRQGPGYRHHHLPLPAGDQQAAVPSHAAPGPGAALPLGGTVSSGGSSLPQTDAAMSQSFPAGANKPLPQLGQACVCTFHALLFPSEGVGRGSRDASVSQPRISCDGSQGSAAGGP